MATWIRVDQTLLDHEKTFNLGEQLELAEPYAAVHVIALWMWAIDHALDGKLPENDKLIARAARWDGPAAPFVEALIAVGFIDDDIHGYRTIHNWEKYAGAMLRRRAANANRMRKARGKTDPEF